MRLRLHAQLEEPPAALKILGERFIRYHLAINGEK